MPRDAVEHPHVAWWISILPPLSLLAALAVSGDLYAWWRAHVFALPGRGWLIAAIVATYVAHAGEAFFCYRLARHLGLRRSAAGWWLQTFVLGFPSLLLLRRRAAEED
jgi:hypothetical protein